MTGAVSEMIRRWWQSDRLLGRQLAVANLAVGVACLAAAALDWRLGLGTYARPFLATMGVIFVGWGLLAGRFGAVPMWSRRIRLAGDLAFWAALVVFTVLGLVAAPTRETGPLVTLLIFLVIAAVNGVRSLRGPA